MRDNSIETPCRQSVVENFPGPDALTRDVDLAVP